MYLAFLQSPKLHSYLIFFSGTTKDTCTLTKYISCICIACSFHALNNQKKTVLLKNSFDVVLVWDEVRRPCVRCACKPCGQWPAVVIVMVIGGISPTLQDNNRRVISHCSHYMYTFILQNCLCKPNS